MYMASKPAHETRTGIYATQKIAKPGETNDPDIASEQIKGIPLYLIWTVIKEQIEKKREAVVHIEVQPSRGHSFTITVKTSERRIYRPSLARKQAAESRGESNE
jgi:uncharacterized protein (DUF779 family)